MGDLGVCPDCGGLLNFEFRRAFADIAHMIYDNEYVTLESFPVQLKCTVCSWRKDSVGREFTIDMAKGVILFGRIDKEDG